VWFLMVSMVPVALGGGILNTLNRSLVTKSVPPEEIGGTLGLSTSIDSMNGIIAPAIGGALLPLLGTWAPGALAAFIMVLVAIYVWRKIVQPDLFREKAARIALADAAAVDTT